MDYRKIYSAFIASRKRISNARGAYTEKHHILPRSLGGSDDPDNLIRLTPEDHYFAHCLLSKIHGGGMWYALNMMACRRNGEATEWVKSRAMYGMARRRVAKETSDRCRGQEGAKGPDNGRYNDTAHDWTNIDTGDRRTATPWEMWTEFGGCRAHWTSAVAKTRKTMKGWTPYPEDVRVRSGKGKKFNFENRDGSTFTGTQVEFAEHAGVSLATASRIVRANSVSVCGWLLKGAEWRAPNSPRNGTRPGKKASILTLVRGSERIAGDRHEIARKLVSTPQQVSAAICMMRNGRTPTYKGWYLEQIHGTGRQVRP